MAPRRTPKELRLDTDQMEIWWSRIIRAYTARKDHQDRWEILKDYYIGNYFNEPSVEDRVSSMQHFAMVRQMASNLYFQDPSMNFVGYTVQGIMDAKASEALYRLERKIMGAEKQERACVDNALTYGTGILKHGWNTQHGIEPAFADTKRRNGKGFGDVTQMSAPHADLNLPLGPWTEHNPTLTFRRPWIKSIRPIDSLVHSDASH